MTDNLLQVKNLNIDYCNNSGKTTHAVKNFSIEVNKGEVFAIAGESGCGKSTLLKSIIKLVQPVSGEILFEGQDINDIKRDDYTPLVQMIFQNPYASLNPKMKIKDILKEPLVINTKYSKSEIERIVDEKIEQVGLSKRQLNLYPHEFSGGQRQRIAIARALMLNPKLILADEPVSALDASIQAQIINLINDLRKELGITILFISHDLNVIKYIADRVAVMYMGELVEMGSVDNIFNNPQHSYTKLLLDSIPKIRN